MEALLGDLKRQMKDLSTAYPQPDHDGQFITQQSTVAVKEDPEDEEDSPQSLWHQNPWSESFQRLKPERQRWLQILWEKKLSPIIGRSSWSTKRLSTCLWFSGGILKLNFPKVDARLKDLRNQLKDLTTAYAKSEDDLKVISCRWLVDELWF